ncbi:hypothetical protein R1sor_021893 [Riccia sorocarpa]|uniref:Uncharacterized protein n=1 Tax=Riccia sorocarpa TaxID=122646 RepID=A0ABD3GLA2_9MARC
MGEDSIPVYSLRNSRHLSAGGERLNWKIGESTELRTWLEIDAKKRMELRARGEELRVPKEEDNSTRIEVEEEIITFILVQRPPSRQIGDLATQSVREWLESWRRTCEVLEESLRALKEACEEGRKPRQENLHPLISSFFKWTGRALAVNSSSVFSLQARSLGPVWRYKENGHEIAISNGDRVRVKTWDWTEPVSAEEVLEDTLQARTMRNAPVDGKLPVGSTEPTENFVYYDDLADHDFPDDSEMSLDDSAVLPGMEVRDEDTLDAYFDVTSEVLPMEAI